MNGIIYGKEVNIDHNGNSGPSAGFTKCILPEVIWTTKLRGECAGQISLK